MYLHRYFIYRHVTTHTHTSGKHVNTDTKAFTHVSLSPVVVCCVEALAPSCAAGLIDDAHTLVAVGRTSAALAACPLCSLRTRHEECLVKKGAKRGPPFRTTRAVSKKQAKVQSQSVACSILILIDSFSTRCGALPTGPDEQATVHRVRPYASSSPEHRSGSAWKSYASMKLLYHIILSHIIF